MREPTEVVNFIMANQPEYIQLQIFAEHLTSLVNQYADLCEKSPGYNPSEGYELTDQFHHLLHAGAISGKGWFGDLLMMTKLINIDEETGEVNQKFMERLRRLLNGPMPPKFYDFHMRTMLGDDSLLFTGHDREKANDYLYDYRNKFRAKILDFVENGSGDYESPDKFIETMANNFQDLEALVRSDVRNSRELLSCSNYFICTLGIAFVAAAMVSAFVGLGTGCELMNTNTTAAPNATMTPELSAGSNSPNYCLQAEYDTDKNVRQTAYHAAAGLAIAGVFLIAIASLFLKLLDNNNCNRVAENDYFLDKNRLFSKIEGAVSGKPPAQNDDHVVEVEDSEEESLLGYGTFGDN